MILPNVDISKDMSAIRNGEGVFKGNTVTVNNRTYEAHVNGTIYPLAGDGFITLTRGEYKALGVYQKMGDTPKTNSILSKMHDVDTQDMKKAYEIWSKWK